MSTENFFSFRPKLVLWLINTRNPACIVPSTRPIQGALDISIAKREAMHPPSPNCNDFWKELLVQGQTAGLTYRRRVVGELVNFTAPSYVACLRVQLRIIGRAQRPSRRERETVRKVLSQHLSTAGCYVPAASYWILRGLTNVLRTGSRDQRIYDGLSFIEFLRGPLFY
jgi:hypothetical protein